MGSPLAGRWPGRLASACSVGAQAGRVTLVLVCLASLIGADHQAASLRVDGTRVAASSSVWFDGESGLAGISSSTQAWSSRAARRQGERGLRLNGRDHPSFAHWGSDQVVHGRRYASVRLWVRLRHKRAGESVDLVTVANARNRANFDLFVTGDTRRFKWDIYRANADQSDFTVAFDRWYLIEARIEYDGNRHTAEVRIDGRHQGTIASQGSPSTVRSLSVGSRNPKWHTQDYDGIALRVGNGPQAWFGA